MKSDPPAGRRHTLTIVLGIVALAVAVRLVLGQTAIDLPPLSDGTHFDRIAHALLDGRGFGERPGFKTAHRAPLQPGWLALCYLLLGRELDSVLLGACILSVGLCLGVMAGARRLAGNDAAIVSGLVVALNPRWVDYAVRLWSLSELLFVALFVLGIVVWAGPPGRLRACLSGLCLGLATLARPVALLFPLGLILVGGRRRWRLAPYLLVATGAALAPWTWRNYQVYERFIPVSTMAGIVFYQGFHPPAEGWGVTPWDEIHALTEGLPSEPDVSDALIRHTLGSIGERPLRAASLLPRKLLWLMSPFSEVDGELDLAFILLAAVGGAAGFQLRRQRDYWPYLGAIGYFPAFALVFYGSARFRLPIEPLLLILACAWVCGAGAASAGRRRLLVGAGIVLMLACLPGWTAQDVREVARGRWPGGDAVTEAPSAR